MWNKFDANLMGISKLKFASNLTWLIVAMNLGEENMIVWY